MEALFLACVGNLKKSKVLNQPTRNKEESEDEIPVISFSAQMSQDDILEELRPAVDAAYASGGVYDKKTLSQTLLTKTQELQHLVRGIEGKRPEGNIWWVDKIRLRIDVKASGMVAPATYLGAMVRFRFQWQRIERKNRRKIFHTPSRSESSITNFVKGMSKDLEAYETLDLKDKNSISNLFVFE